MSNTTTDRFTYLSDAARRLVLVTAFEMLTGDDLVAVIDRQREDGSWSFGIVYDMRRVTEAISREEAARVAEHARFAVVHDGPRGRVALVTTSADVIASGLQYSYRTSQNLNVAMCAGLPEAIAWVTDPRPPRRDGHPARR
jgi:hypothetical protein